MSRAASSARLRAPTLFIGITVLETRETLVYVCDGKTVSEWFRGNALSTAVSLTSGTSKLEAALSLEASTGEVTLEPGTPRRFKAFPVADTAGLYRATLSENGLNYVGGWVVLSNGEQRGAVTTVGSPTGTSPTVQGSSAQTPVPAGTPKIVQNPILAVTPIITRPSSTATALPGFLATLGASSNTSAQQAANTNFVELRMATTVRDTANLATPTPTPVVLPIPIASGVVLQPQKLTSTGAPASLN